MGFSLFERKQVLVTGANGFIGSSVVKAFAANGASVTGIIRQNSDLSKLVDFKNKVDLRIVNLEDAVAVNELLKEIRPNYIVHAAQPSAHAAYGLSNPAELLGQLRLTASIATNLLEAAKSYLPEKFVHCCGSAIYGNLNTSPFTEDCEPMPDSPRGLIKLQERNLMRYYAQNFNMPVVLGRIFRAYGPWDSSKKIIVKALDVYRNGGSLPLSPEPFMRDYVFIDDISEGILRMCATNLPNGTELNLGSGMQYSAAQIVKELELLLNKHIDISTEEFPKNFLDKMQYAADLSKTRKLLKWTPNTSLKDGLKATIKWHKRINE